MKEWRDQEITKLIFKSIRKSEKSIIDQEFIKPSFEEIALNAYRLKGHRDGLAAFRTMFRDMLNESRERES